MEGQGFLGHSPRVIERLTSGNDARKIGKGHTEIAVSFLMD
jgi:hypothetical protein